jgi:ribosomal protein S18 acetylase RimI-like enzyme
MEAFPGSKYDYAENIGTSCLNLVAEDLHGVVGFTSVLLRRWDARGNCLWERLAPYIGVIVVRSDCRGHGIGSDLLKTVIERVHALLPGETALYLECKKDNRSIRLYERTGFKRMSDDESIELVGLKPAETLFRFPLN